MSPPHNRDERSHSHAHGKDGQGGHAHPMAEDADRRFLASALALILAFMVAEVVVGLAANSLALISDAGHMLTDAASIVLALVAMRLALRPAAGRLTYGWRRVEILSAMANGVTLLLLATYFTIEAIVRLVEPPDTAGLPVLVTALAGIVVNVAASWLISRANRTSLNVEGAFQHILNDLYAFIATAIAGLVVLLTGFIRADAIATLVVAALMFRAGAGLVAAAGRIFLEAAPAALHPDEIGTVMAAEPAVAEVHDLHVWEVTSGLPALSAHVLVNPPADCHQTRRELETLLESRFGIDHTTLQVDHLADETTAVNEIEDARETPHGARYRSDAIAPPAR